MTSFTEQAHIVGRISQAEIASFIGVTPVSLSRLLSTRRSKPAP